MSASIDAAAFLRQKEQGGEGTGGGKGEGEGDGDEVTWQIAGCWVARHDLECDMKGIIPGVAIKEGGSRGTC